MPRGKKPVAKKGTADTFEPIVDPIDKEDTMGRTDILIQKGVRRLVERSGDPAILGLYGRFGGTFNSLVSDIFGPLEKRKGAKA